MKTGFMRIVLAAVLLAQVGWGKTIGFHKDGRSIVTDGMIKTFQDAGWTTVFLTTQELEKDEALAKLDLLMLTGGWNAYYFPSFAGRRALTRFVASGKGILSSGFRSGYSRTANRPIFPQVGATYNRGNASFLVGVGDSPFAKALSEPITCGGWDHMALAVGPEGKVFAECAGDPVGAYGEVYGGRVIVMGVFFGWNAPSNGMQGASRNLMMTMADWLAAAPKRSPAEIESAQKKADLDFQRREKIWDWTLNDRGPDNGPGLIPGAANTIAGQLEGPKFQLKYMAAQLSDPPKSTAVVIGELDKALAKLEAAQKAYTAETVVKINGMSVEALLNEMKKNDESKAAIRARLFPTNELAVLRAGAQRAIGELRAPVRAAKAKRLAAERKEDARRVKALAEAAGAADVKTRLDAVVELGRIGNPDGADALIKALGDADETVRVNAILGLGWMQAKPAVPALLALAEGKDLRMKRRAAQALGQIGDARAVPALMKLAKDSDPFTAENAIFALGWLKAREAVPMLTDLVKTLDKKNGIQRGLRLTAIRALGHIGDPAAVPVLESVVQEGDDIPWNRAGRKPIVNVYSTAQSLGFKYYAEQAIASIQAGGAAKAGIAQPDFLGGADRFYALTKRFNALAGRCYDFMDMAGDDGSGFLAMLKDAGWTGIHMAWGAQDAEPDAYFKAVQAAGELDMLWIDTWPWDGNMFGAKGTVTASRQMALEKAAGDLLAERYANEPAFAGLWSEETYPWIVYEPAEFEAWFKAKYGVDPLKKYGLPAGFELTREAVSEGVLKTDFLDYCGDKMMAHWQESQDWMHGLRKACALTFSISHRHIVTYPGLNARLSDRIDVPGPEVYQSFGRDNAFMMEMFKNGRARPVMCEFYNWYTPSPAHEIRGFAQHLMHGECFYNFGFEHVFKYAKAYNWAWAPTRWDNAKAIFQKAAKLKEYVAVPESAANVALLCSETAACHLQNTDTLGARWYEHQAGLWTALSQSQIPADVIWTETLTPAVLARYRVLVMADAKLLSDAEMGLLRDWVKQGGVLIAGGSSTIFDWTFTPRKDYALGDLFGVTYGGFAGVTDPAKSDTVMYAQKGGYMPLAYGMEVPAVRNHVMREVKPVKSIGVYKVAKNETLPGLAVGAGCEYDMPLGYDKVTPVSAETLAAFANGDPALTVNRVGNGLCYFWTPIYPGLCFVGSEFENDANRKDFWPNVRELLAAMVKGGLAHQRAALPAAVAGVSKDVEVTLRQQPERNRMMVHLLDYDTKSTGVKGAVLTVQPPAGKTVKRIFHPDTGTDIPYTAADGGITARLREFNVHELVVVEWDR